MTDKETVAIYLAKNDREIVRELAAMYDLSFSAAVTMIIREWARNDRRMPAETNAAPKA